MLNTECTCVPPTTAQLSLRDWMPLSTDMLNTHMINGHLKRLVLTLTLDREEEGLVRAAMNYGLTCIR